MELSLVETSELIAELKRRSKALVIARLAAADNHEENKNDNVLFDWSGGSVQAQGLASLATSFIRQINMGRAVYED